MAQSARGSADFRARPFAVRESCEAERARIERLRVDDPIELQDIFNTSTALVDAAREGDVEELRRVVADAEEGELLRPFVLKAFLEVLKRASLELVRDFVHGGLPVEELEELSQSLHIVCEVTNRDNFSDAWRIVQLLSQGRLDINAPRSPDGWTPLCVACADACLPLVFKLIELEADPNVITRANMTPLALARERRDGDGEEQQEARGIISNMLRSYGAQENWKDALHRQKRPRAPKPAVPAGESVTVVGEDGTEIVSQTVSATHTRFAA
ncbi:unnamed protein product [Prorocentrum cordatum]|uniref:Uncharacterized protein n=1 Tax=Prorocentrum cordatum TaxID=2364126 RepID=A0ABN9ULG5_9DINO|nr:unnamed protein product [Polarella glacialis]